MAITQTFDPLAEDAIDLLRCASDDELLAHTAEIEAYGRRVDALRVVAAAEVAHRSRRELEGAALSAQKGCRNASELLQRVTGAAGRTVESWMRLGAQLRGRPTLIGIEGPADFPAVTVAVTEGRIGVDVATAIVTALAPTIGRAHPEDFAAAEQALVTAAGESTADSIRVQAAVWQAAIDPDGVEPSEERAMARRGIRLGRARDGLIPISGGLMPEAAGALSRLFDAHLTPRTAPAFLSAEERDAQSLERDPRTPDQQRHDVFMGIVDSAARAADAPSIGGAAPTVLVSVRADDLDRGGGAGYIDGVEAPVSIRAVGQKICAGGSQRVVIDPTGRVVQLGVPQRVFNSQQRRAIGVRDGGCLIPDCPIPAAWSEIHHVLEWANGGKTHTDNGVLLCWFHHRTIDSSGWQIRMVRGSPQIKAPPWIDPNADWRPATKSRTRLADEIDGSG
ncbi:HNH endonuclease signature motif containing protein [Diaminobutyricimonas sp. TR449]|uniref:HNH endonuclease signature motif containing protein n=1 Tax=Diaminobutyricimonas sp. TR449 TaxID=2708076 RepID=UPI00141E3D75|nr:HNH endonuclease signature motif containing protein [Diaminobutyricimonas sp. TR449]